MRKGNKYKCKLCNGDGKVDSGWWAPIIEDCPICKGKGVVDWVTNIIWKEKIKQHNIDKDIF